MKKNILVVGGAGYVGGYLVDILNDNSLFNVRVFDKLIYEEDYLKDVDFVYGDIRNEKLLNQHLLWADTVVWIAALVGDGACEIDHELTYEINTQSVEFLCKNFNKEIIFFSTCSVYGVNNDIIDEKAKVNPLSTYAKTKLDAEKFIIENNGMVFRLGTLFGTGDKFSRVRLDLVLNILTLKAVLEKEITVFGGQQFRPLLHVKDAAKAIELSINNFVPGLYNLHFDNFTIKDIAMKILDILPNTKINFIDKKFQDLRNYRVNGDLIRKVIKFNPTLDLIDGINEIKYLVENSRIKNPNNIRYTNVEYLKNNEI